MHDASLAFLKNLLQTPSPSGFERQIQDVVRAWAKPIADEVRTDRHGNVIAVLNPGGKPRIMLAGHCDQIALMVQHIDDNGFLYVQPIGGWDMQILLGQNLTVWAKDGGIPGVVSRKAPHLLTSEERNKVPQFTDVWVDIGAKDKQGGRDAGHARRPGHLRPGLPRAAQRPAHLARPGRQGRRLDRHGGAAAPARPAAAGGRLLRLDRAGGDRPARRHHQRLRHPPDRRHRRGCRHATDTPGNDKKQLGDTKLGAGPVLFRGPNINPHVLRPPRPRRPRVTRSPSSCAACPRATGTDANAMQLTRDGVATGLVGIPNRYMHSPVEVVSLDDLDRAARLLAEFCLSVTPEMDWMP